MVVYIRRPGAWLWDWINSAFAIGVAAHEAAHGQVRPLDYAMFFYSLRGIFRTARMKLTVPVRVEVAQQAMVEGNRSLIQANKEQKHFTHAIVDGIHIISSALLCAKRPKQRLPSFQNLKRESRVAR